MMGGSFELERTGFASDARPKLRDLGLRRLSGFGNARHENDVTIVEAPPQRSPPVESSVERDGVWTAGGASAAAAPRGRGRSGHGPFKKAQPRGGQTNSSVPAPSSDVRLEAPSGRP